MSTTETGIGWTDRTWNPVRGCSRVSEGCRHCYAETVAARFSGPGLAYEGLATRVNGHAAWTGKVVLVESALSEPLRWKKPARIFVNSMSDLFHESLTDDQILRVLNAIRAGHAMGHTFQVLTKRAERMRSMLSRLFFDARGEGAMGLEDRGLNRQGLPISFAPLMKRMHVGVSVEDRGALGRIDELRQTPLACRFLSIEPLLEDVGTLNLTGIHWVIVGGESGHVARMCDLAWIRSVVRQCATAGVPCFVKQLGANPHVKLVNSYGPGVDAYPYNMRYTLKDRKGADRAEWPSDLQVQQFPLAEVI